MGKLILSAQTVLVPMNNEMQKSRMQKEFILYHYMDLVVSVCLFWSGSTINGTVTLQWSHGISHTEWKHSVQNHKGYNEDFVFLKLDSQ